ncbi:MAG: hypothetical protein EOO40_01430 [Deltaproteobacteria bacterium]|nr:MAG: hypothetical protein EOO40_01430 [Deltaproteobacteria bacterium]
MLVDRSQEYSSFLGKFFPCEGLREYISKANCPSFAASVLSHHFNNQDSAGVRPATGPLFAHVPSAVWSRGAAFAEVALRPCHRDGDRLAASTLARCRLPVPSVALLAEVPSGKLGGGAAEATFFRCLRAELLRRLARLQSWPETRDPAAELALSKRLDHEAMQHFTVLVVALADMALRRGLGEQLTSRLIADWQAGMLPAPYRDLRPGRRPAHGPDAAGGQAGVAPAVDRAASACTEGSLRPRRT